MSQSVTAPSRHDSMAIRETYVSDVGEFVYFFEHKNARIRLRLQSVVNEQIESQGVSWSFGHIIRYASNGREPESFDIPLKEAFDLMRESGEFRVMGDPSRDPLRMHGNVSGWNSDLCIRFVQVARRWHMNNLRSECEHQREMEWESCAGHRSVSYEYEVNIPRHPRFETDWQKMTGGTRTETGEVGYTQRKHNAKKIADTRTIYFESGRHYWWNGSRVIYCYDRTDHPCPVCGYRFRGPWLYEKPPENVVAFVDSIKAISTLTDRR